jgi:hypothetical protein
LVFKSASYSLNNSKFSVSDAYKKPINFNKKHCKYFDQTYL